MKKNIFVFALILSLLTFLYAEESETTQNTQDMSEQFLQALIEEESDSNFLDALQDSDEAIAEQNEIISKTKKVEQKKVKQKKEKKRINLENRSEWYPYLGLGAGAAFDFNSNKDNEINAFPLQPGFSILLIYNMGYFTYKISPLIEENANVAGSIGLSPIHNSKGYLGLYASIGSDEIEDYRYTGWGVGGTLIFKISDLSGVYINFDAINRAKAEYKGEKEIPPSLPGHIGTWNICSSIGFCLDIGW